MLLQIVAPALHISSKTRQAPQCYTAGKPARSVAVDSRKGKGTHPECRLDDALNSLAAQFLCRVQ